MVTRVRHRARLLTILLTLVMTLGIIARPHPSFACTVATPIGGPPTVADHVRAASIVLEGRVLGVVGDRIATIAVDKYYKGYGPARVTVDGYGPASACLSDVYVGQVAIFYVSGDAQRGYHAAYLSGFEAIAPNDVTTIAQITAASGQPPVPPKATDEISGQVTTTGSQDLTRSITETGGFALVLIVIAALFFGHQTH